MPLVLHVPDEFAFPGTPPTAATQLASSRPQASKCCCCSFFACLVLSAPSKLGDTSTRQTACSALCSAQRSRAFTTHAATLKPVLLPPMQNLIAGGPASPTNLLDSLDRLSQPSLEALQGAIVNRGAGAIAAELAADVSSVRVVGFVDCACPCPSPERVGCFVEVARPHPPNGPLSSVPQAAHGMTFQAVGLPNGLICHFYGPAGTRNEWSVLRESGVLERLHGSRALKPFQIYGGSGYFNASNVAYGRPIGDVLGWSPDLQHLHSLTGSGWSFAYMRDLCSFISYPRKLRFTDDMCGKIVRIAALLTNLRICSRGRCQVSDYFGTSASIPSLDQYATGTSLF